MLDRDDTLNENAGLPAEAFGGVPGDLFDPTYVELMPGVLDACRRLHAAGYVLVVITNQGCVARGHASLSDVDATNDRLRELLVDADGHPLLEAVYAGVHHPDAAVEHLREVHSWRKPGPGMVLAAARDLGLDLGACWMVGDKERDVECAVAAGVPRERCFRIGDFADADAPDLPAAADAILAADRPESRGRGTTVSLRAPSGTPLADTSVRSTVEATASAIAERTGVGLLALRCDDRSVTAELATHRLAAMGFMAELRRLTNRWHAARRGGDLLWPAADVQDDEDENRRDA